MKAAALLATAHEAGVRVHLDGQSQLRLAYRRDTDPALLARLRQHKPELIELLSGNRCRYCGEPIDWSVPGARAFGDVTAAHNGCWEQTETDRLLAAGRCAVDPHLADDVAELGLHGQPLP